MGLRKHRADFLVRDPLARIALLAEQPGVLASAVALGSIEYAVAVLKTPLVVVMGHESCGAVKAATQVVTDTPTNHTQPDRISRGPRSSLETR